jgi:hypothetical protein
MLLDNFFFLLLAAAAITATLVLAAVVIVLAAVLISELNSSGTNNSNFIEWLELVYDLTIWIVLHVFWSVNLGMPCICSFTLGVCL